MLQVQQIEDPQEWIVVTKNKNRHKGSIKDKKINDRGNQSRFSLESREQYMKKFMSAKQFQFNSALVKKTLEKIKDKSSSIQYHVECLGLGNFLSSKKSYLQLEFMQLIILPIVKEQIKQTTKTQHVSQKLIPQSLSVNVYDPAFSKAQSQQIQQKGYTLTQNYKIQQGKINIFFMPHCQRNLYQSVYEDYEKISNRQQTTLIVIGNSIQQYRERCHLIKQKVPQIFERLKVSQEKIMDYENAFNDTFVLV